MALTKKKIKTQEERKIYSKIFDNLTIQDLFKMKARGIYENYMRIVNEGKESKILLVKDKDGKLKIIKVYKVETSNFKNMWEYISGDERFKKIGKGKRDIVYTWCKKEYHNLQLAYESKVNVPRPYYYIRNMIVMEFIGNKEGEAAPKLRSIVLDDPKKIFYKIISELKKMLKNARIVHGDISEYNIVVHNNDPYLLDLGQGVLISHPRAREFYERDINNIINYFIKRYGLSIDKEKIKKEVGKGIFYV